ncbi:MAG: hypothetical protein IKU40_09545 [Clostridia bacterium]|nr:hypothetical protein [Clostridia bacterium]
MAKNKKVISDKAPSGKVVGGSTVSYDAQCPIWRFDQLDRSGEFAFDIERVNHRLVLEKLIEYGNLTWGEIKRQTHDRTNKSKHHHLTGAKLSKEAEQRIRVKCLEEDIDDIFSFALMNKIRIIGLKRDAEFHIVWYDEEHRFCPSTK